MGKRILTTHTGSLPRTQLISSLIQQRISGESIDVNFFNSLVKEAIIEALSKQIELGIDIVNDGEICRVGYSNYVSDRLSGFQGDNESIVHIDDLDSFPKFKENVMGKMNSIFTPICVSDVKCVRPELILQELRTLKDCGDAVGISQAFMTAASPGVIALFLENQHYATHEEYVFALADAMRHEYESICNAGYILQLDCPDLAMGKHVHFRKCTQQDFLRNAAINIEALNYAVKNIPSDQMRMHLCWGNYEGPHQCDVELKDIIELVFKAKPSGILIEAANPRHAHEWEIFTEVKLPADKVLIPGVIDPKTHYVEHPKLVAQRIGNYAQLVGAERVIAGVDCGFSSFAGGAKIDSDIIWAKMESLRMGADIASSHFFR